MNNENQFHDLHKSAELDGTGTRVLREILRTPAFVEIIKVNSDGLDPKNARALVRTALSEDSSLSLGLLSKSPDAINYIAEALYELIMQLEKFPPDLFDHFISQIIDDLDGEAFSRVSAAATGSLSRILLDNPIAKQKVIDSLVYAVNRVTKNAVEYLNKSEQSKGPGLGSALEKLDVDSLAEVLSLSAGLMNKTLDENPEVFSRIQKKTDTGQVFRLVYRIGYAMVKGMFKQGIASIISLFRPKKNG